MYDLVCGMKLEAETSYRAEHEGRSVFFCSERCLTDFRKDPAHYAGSEPAILLEDVYKKFQLGDIEVSVLRGLSLRVHKGDFVALVGPSGSGKSTAMAIIGTLDLPTSGLVRIGGQDATAMKEAQLSKLRSEKIGFVFQQFNLVNSLDAVENVMLPKMLKGEAGPAVRERAMMLLESVGLKGRTSHRPMELSGGEQQRVAIARAFMNDPEIILADEPTGNLDSTTSGKVIDLLYDLWQKHRKTIVIITHDAHVASHAQRVMSMMDGRLVSNHGLAEKSIWKDAGHHKADATH